MHFTTFNCPIAKVSVIVERQYLGKVAGIGDDAAKSQYDYQCQREATCTAARLIQQCPLHSLRR
jgi:hypothetical protein